MNLLIHGTAPLLVDVSRFNNTGDTVLIVCNIECGLIEVKDETGADNVRRRQVLPTGLCIQRNRLSGQLLDLSDFIQAIAHHETGDVAGRTNRKQNCRRLLRRGPLSNESVARPVMFLGDPS